MERTRPLVARLANHDATCPRCGQAILGFDGKLGDVDMLRPPQHPLDLLDAIVKVDGRWVHADCAADAGYRVIG
jgi:hypothetical protein